MELINFAALRSYCTNNFQLLGMGASRVVYAHPYDAGIVIKIPLNLDEYCLGQQMSEIEALERYKEHPYIPKFFVEHVRFANGRTLPIIYMERLSPLPEWEKSERFKDWFLMLYDGVQIGKNSQGMLKVYDLGLGFGEVPFRCRR